MLIPDPNFSIPDPGSKVKKIPGSASASKNLSILTQKLFLSSLMIWDVHPGSGSWIRILNFCPSQIPDPGSRGQKGTRSQIPVYRISFRFRSIHIPYTSQKKT
jgi:hypothetical protein